MLRLVREGEKAPQNDALRTALDRVRRWSSTQVGFHILEVHEAEALYRVLVSRNFTQDQLDAWIDRLRADHPYDRKAVGPQPGLWAWVKWVILGGDKPQPAPTESVTDWAKRNERWVQVQVASVDQRRWLERPLQTLTVARHQIEHETGEAQWSMPVLRWALVQLLTAPSDVATSDIHATG